jgi:hypothetical protein
MRADRNINDIIDTLVNWIEKNNYYGHDIYDLYAISLFQVMLVPRPALLRKVMKKLINWCILLFPNTLIKIFRVKKNINHKAMGLIMKAYCNLYQVRKNSYYLELAEKIALWLIQNRSLGYKNFCWGYPFDWKSKQFVPKNTPSSVVSSIVGDGFFSIFKITGNQEYLLICQSICRFFIDELNIDNVDDSKICFSYTPIDNNHVHNANLFVAEFLIRVGQETGNELYIDYGRKAVQYTLSEQNSNGSILYWGDKDKRHRKFSYSNMDHYHSGFEIRMLYKIACLLRDKKIFEAYRKYYSFYRKNYIAGSAINYRPGQRYPIDIHSCSEVIICNSVVEDGLYTGQRWFQDIIGWINLKMLDHRSLYIYMIRNILFFEIKIKINFMRWGQAWMLLAFSEFLLWKKKANRQLNLSADRNI